MSTLTEKIDKQFTYKQTVYKTSLNPMDLFVSVDGLTDLMISQVRDGAKPKKLRSQIKAELESRADAREIRRWSEVHGSSYRSDREDHYFLRQQVQS